MTVDEPAHSGKTVTLSKKHLNLVLLWQTPAFPPSIWMHQF